MIWIFAGNAAARRNGYLGNCNQCHTGATGAEVSLTLDPDVFEPGAVVHLTVTVSSPTIAVGGLFLNDSGVGEFISSSGDISVRSAGTQVTHTSPKPASGGQVMFSLDWQAPATPRAVHFDLYAVAANNNNAFTGDSVAYTQVTRLFGCEGKTFYRDFDGDGYGSVMFPTTTDCVAPIGFAPLSGDCDENDKDTNPGAQETCNNTDDNCDGRIDEFAAPSCGVGLCRRYADYCADTAPCRPGDPMEEECDGLDDDCDGLIDEGKLCAGDLVCQGASCKTLEAALAADPNFVPSEDGTPETPVGGASFGGTGSTGNNGGVGGISPGVGGSANGGAGGGISEPQSDGGGKSGCSVSSSLPPSGARSWLTLVLVGLCFRRRRSR